MPLASMRDRSTRPTSMRLAAGGGGAAGSSLSRATSRNVSPTGRRSGPSLSPPGGESLAPKTASLIPNERIPRMLPKVPAPQRTLTLSEPQPRPQPQPRPNP